jgi:predicted RNase H-like HicB family nuclease
MTEYRIILKKEEEGGYTAIVPSLPGCITYGDTIDEAKLMVREAIELYIESLEADGLPVPNDNESLEYSLVM